ncbi:MAG: hypothetical protein JXA73_01575 [Acidobacteria bacterium]|nr:hypothetical protein [Acidobacteriota bacterium]
MRDKNRCHDWILLTLMALLALAFICNRQESLAQDQTIKNSIPVPEGYHRQTYPAGTFSSYIQNLGLKNPPVIKDYRGGAVRTAFYHVWGVVHMPLLFQSNLEQCADFAMRFWAEYHRSAGKLDQLYLFDYGGNKKPFRLSGKSYIRFLRTSFANTNSYSLKKGCKPLSDEDVIPGDLFVQNERGGIGHVSVIMDACRSKDGRRLFLIGYSFMPAQEFHIEKATETYGIQGWFSLEGYKQYLKDFLDFGEPVLRRFEPL